MLGGDDIERASFGLEDVRTAVRFPTGSPDWVKRVALVMVGVLLLFPGLGYGSRVMQAAAEGSDLPSVDDWWEMTKTGLVMGSGLFVVMMTVGASGLAVIVVVANVVVNGIAVSSSLATLVFGAFVVFAVGLYFTPALLANIARTGSMFDGFDYTDVGRTGLTVEYALAWLTGGVIWVGGVFVSNVLTFVLVGLFLYAYVFVVVFYIWGRGFALGLEARGVEY